MPFVTSCRAVGVVLAAVIGFVPLAPAEHAHKVKTDGHHQVRVHRHAQAHGDTHSSGAHRVAHGLTHDLAHDLAHDGVLDDEDTPLLRAEAVFTVPAVLAGPGAPPRVTFVLVEPPAADVFSLAADEVELLIHGPPPTPASLRAPPISPAL